MFDYGLDCELGEELYELLKEINEELSK